MSEVTKAYKTGFVSLYRILCEMEISDELKAYLLHRYNNETECVSNYDESELDLIQFNIWYKYREKEIGFMELVNDYYECFEEMYGNKINMIAMLNNTDCTNVIDFQSYKSI